MCDVNAGKTLSVRSLVSSLPLCRAFCAAMLVVMRIKIDGKREEEWSHAMMT